MLFSIIGIFGFIYGEVVYFIFKSKIYTFIIIINVEII